MNTRIKTLEEYRPRRSFFFSIDEKDEDRPMTKEMRRTLTELIYQTMDEEGRERLLAQLVDMTQAEAKEKVNHSKKRRQSQGACRAIQRPVRQS